MTDNALRPPVDIEQWIDIIIASASHRSHDEGQRKFGELILQKYFIDMPKEYKNDLVARGYLDNILCAVASAIRGFSVVRDIFETQWQSLKEAKARELARAERIDNFSPFKPDGYWKRALIILGSVGLIDIILASIKNYIGNLPWTIVLIFFILGLIVLGLMELLVDHIRNNRLAQVEKNFPDDLMNKWQESTLSGYRMVCRQFLYLAIKIREEYYPDLSTYNGSKIYEKYSIPNISIGHGNLTNLDEINQFITLVVEQHFAYKTKSKSMEDKK